MGRMRNAEEHHDIVQLRQRRPPRAIEYCIAAVSLCPTVSLERSLGTHAEASARTGAEPQPGRTRGTPGPAAARPATGQK